MARWSGVVAALPPRQGDTMGSRLQTHLHPVAGRPLIWHAVSALTSVRPAPETVLVLASDLPPDLFHDIAEGPPILMVGEDSADRELGSLAAGPVLLMGAATVGTSESLGRLLSAPAGTRMPSADGEIGAAHLLKTDLQVALTGSFPAATATGTLEGTGTLVVRDRGSLAAASRAIRDRLIDQLMAAGVTFILPDSVLVDVDVRIGRDSVIYPGAVLEGQTTVGEETVIGPGCRIISSWIGSGAEMKGWNYIAHTSVRNRAILEPYVRRGFD